MEQSSSWEVNSYFACQEIPRPFKELKVQYCVHKSSLLAPTLIQINPLNIIRCLILTVISFVILTDTPCI